MWSLNINKRFNKFDHRSDSSKHYSNSSIVIKIPVTKWKRAQSWGDYHLAVLLKEQLEKNSHRVLIQILPEWNNKEGLEYDVTIVLRGLSRYTLKPNQLNIMWNISHPNTVSVDEYQEYDHVFIASNSWANEVATKVSTPVTTMLQCTDTDRFKEPDTKDKKVFKHQLLFVGNSRDTFRKILKDLLPTRYDLAVYGKNWKAYLPKEIIKADHISNDQLYKYYGSADILLNDHWDDMREKGFISNRLYDGLACGSFIITDSVNGLGELEKYVQVYDTAEDLQKLIQYYLENPGKRKNKSQLGMKYVQDNHTFEIRAGQFTAVIQRLMRNKSSTSRSE